MEKTVKEIIDEVYASSKEITNFEVWKYSDKTHRLHTDFIENLDGIYSKEQYENLMVDDYYIMDEHYYDETICANGCVRADFEEWYDNKDAKVLVIMIAYDQK